MHHRQKQGYEFNDKNYLNILKRYEELIESTISGYDKIYNKTKAEKLACLFADKQAFALKKHKHLFLKFIKEKDVCFDNNLAERDLRPERSEQMNTF